MLCTNSVTNEKIYFIREGSATHVLTIAKTIGWRKECRICSGQCTEVAVFTIFLEDVVNKFFIGLGIYLWTTKGEKLKINTKSKLYLQAEGNHNNE